jgi:RNA polymerase sigma factor (sigma-70 family)
MVEDRRLLEGFRRGEPEALVRVYRHAVPRVAGLLKGGFGFESGGRRCQFHGTRSAFDLEDRVQEVFARAFSERARLAYDGLSSYEGYVLGIARNLIIDDFRKKERALVEYSIELPEPAPGLRPGTAFDPLLGHLSPSGDPHEDLGRAELVGLVRRFAEGLPHREQEVYRLRFVEELEHRDIAHRTGLSPAKIKTSEQRIRARFFEFMQAHGYFTGYVQEERGWLRWVRSFGRGA